MGTETFSTAISYTDGFYNIVQAANNDMTVEIHNSDLKIVSHPSNANLFYMNQILLDFTKVTTPAGATRDLMIAAIVALNGAIGSNPLDRGAWYSTSTVSTNAGLQTAPILRVNPAFTHTVHLTYVNVSSTVGGAGCEVAIDYNGTIVGGTWAAVQTGSNVQVNTGGTLSAGTGTFIIDLFCPSSLLFNCESQQILLNPGDTFSVLCQNNGALLPTTRIALGWIERNN